jgi:hypothetical protein
MTYISVKVRAERKGVIWQELRPPEMYHPQLDLPALFIDQTHWKPASKGVQMAGVILEQRRKR